MRRAELQLDKAAQREAERQIYEDQAIGVADRIRRREARLPVARAEAKAPGADAAAQTEEEPPPDKSDEPVPQAFMGLDLDWLTEEVGAAVTWGAAYDAPL